MPQKITFGESRLPQVSGDLTLYGSPTGRLCIYVNGIMNVPADHRDTCQSLYGLTGSRVLGVYNRSGVNANASSQSDLPLSRLLIDLHECAQDWVMIAGQATGLPSGPSVNMAIYSLCFVLASQGSRWPSSPLVIVAHSQGNLATANALFMFSKMVSQQGLKHPKIHVVGLASPAPSWPANDFITVKLFSHLKDPVVALGVGRSNVGAAGVTVSDNCWSHSADTYLDDPLVTDWLWKVLKTPDSTKQVVLKERKEKQALQQAEAAALKAKAAKQMETFIKYSNYGPKY